MKGERLIGLKKTGESSGLSGLTKRIIVENFF